MPSIRLNAFSPPAYFSPEQLRDIHAGVLEILEDVGSDLHHDGAVKLLKDAGAFVSGGRVYLPSALVERALKTAPSRIMLYNREGRPAMDLHGRNAYFGTGSDCIYLMDSFTGLRRRFSEKDMIDAVRLSDALPNVDFLMSMGLISEADPRVQYQMQYANLLKYSAKPQVVIAGNRECLNDILDLAAAVVPGGREELERKPRFLLYDEPTSPLVHTFEAVDKLIFSAENRIPTNYSAGMLSGATGPVTLAGAISVAAAEALLGLTIHQLVNPGAPYVFGAGMSNIDMVSMQPTYASPEAMMLQAGLCELGRNLYNLPTWGFAGCCASKVADTQAINEASTYIFMAGLTGTNVNHDLGYLEFGLTFSFDLLVMTDESVGQLRRIMDGISVNRETQALDVIREVGPGGSFLASDHTLDHYRENWSPGVSDRNTFERWTELGATTMEQRCKARIKEILNRPAEPANAAAVDAVLKKITG
ncbi:MAG: trimethylamine methyltransferase family protein [Spirochaetaceae bacterium]|jgi:trimethylamine--corrinoid protein Co-methyltransferase|nr:trimethylamine methyltransferase family protein [Spirochaetaceae bacterium]